MGTAEVGMLPEDEAFRKQVDLFALARPLGTQAAMQREGEKISFFTLVVQREDRLPASVRRLRGKNDQRRLAAS